MGPSVNKDKKKKDKKKKKTKTDSGALKMINGFTVLRFTGILGMKNISFNKEELLKLNKKLNRIRKPKNYKKK